MSVPLHIPTCSIQMNNKFVHIVAYSGYRLMVADYEATQNFLKLNEENHFYGQVILKSIKESRLIPLDEFREVKTNLDLQNAEWNKNICEKYGFRNKNDIYLKMASCSVKLIDSKLQFRPLHHERGDAWTSTFRGEEDYVIIPADSPPEKVGEAMWQALRRCTGRRPDILNQE